MAKYVSKVSSGDRIQDLIQSNIIPPLNSVLAIPLNSGLLLSDISLSAGANIINHTLGRALIGWIITRINSGTTIYDTQASNTIPDKTLNLTSSNAASSVSIFVF